MECDCHHGTHWAEDDQNTPAGSNSLNKQNVLHGATLINVALHPVYSHVFMALLVEPQPTAELHKEALSSFGPSKWIGKPNKRGDWQWRNSFQQAWNGRHGYSTPGEIIWGFQQNLIQKIYKKGLHTPTASLPSILLGLLDWANRPILDYHIKCLGPKQWQCTGNKV